MAAKARTQIRGLELESLRTLHSGFCDIAYTDIGYHCPYPGAMANGSTEQTVLPTRSTELPRHLDADFILISNGNEEYDI